jgi:hypothetical protein
MPNRAGSILSGLIVTVVTLAVLEIGARIAFGALHLSRFAGPEVEYPYHPYLGWETLPNHTYRGIIANGLYSWTIRTDSLGNSATPDFEDPDPEVTVVVLGGSAVFGVGQTDNRFTIPSTLERELNRRTGLRVEVRNLATGGYTSFQEMLALERFLSTRSADVVLTVSGYNDAFAAAIENGPDFGLLLHRLDPKTELVRSMERGELKVVPIAAEVATQELRRRSALVDLLGKVSERVRRAPPPAALPDVPVPDSTELARRARFVLTNYAMMDGLARQRGARFFMFTQPTAMTRRALTREEEAGMDSLSQDFRRRALAAVRVFYPVMIGAEKRFEFHDITHCFDDFDGPAYTDECHYRDRATEVIARAVADVITPAVVEAARRHSR